VKERSNQNYERVL
jgi:hypothetical protein